MKIKLFTLLITILSINSYSQISFEKGYYINNFNEKIDCLIKNIDWKNNPTEIKYKLYENDEPKTLTIESINEFGVYNNSKYVKFTVEIDRSINKINRLSSSSKANFKTETLLLKLLVDGKANLYAYEDGDLKRYFYSLDNGPKIEQLIHKKYKNGEHVYVNDTYKQQLWNNLKCQNILLKDVKRISYNKKELTNFFKWFNECENSEFTTFENKQKKDLFNLTIRPGLNNSSLSIQNSASNARNTDFGSALSFRFGIETEFIMPFNKNKWSLIIEPTYQYFKSEKKTSTQVVNADYKSLEIPFGVRHYFFLNDNSKIFINGLYVIDFSLDSKITFQTGSDLDIKTDGNLAFGFGYNYNKKYSIELRYGANRTILGDYSFWSDDFRMLSVIFGYSIF